MFAAIPSMCFSTHILGGDLSVQHVEDDLFSVHMKLFRDCGGLGAALDNSVTLYVYEEGTNTLLTDLSFTMTLGEVEFPELGDECFTPDICLEIGNYIETISLPDNPNGLYLVWERCCRSPAIVNLEFPDDIGMVFVATIPDPALDNSSPFFSEYPTDGYFCVSTLNQFTFAAEDVDGDSLVYLLDNPQYGDFTSPDLPLTDGGSPKPHNSANWLDPYSLASPVGGTPPMTVDPVTGLISAAPDNIGLFAFAILVEEWRDGVKLGEIRREISLASTTCAADIPPDYVDFDVYDTVYFDIYANNVLDIIIEDNPTDTISQIYSGELFDGTYSPLATFETITNVPGLFHGVLLWDSLDCEMLINNPYHAYFLSESENACTGEISTDTLHLAIILEKPDQVPTVLLSPTATYFDYPVLADTSFCFDVIAFDGNYQDTLLLLFDQTSELFTLDEPAVVSDAMGTIQVSTEFCWTPDCQDVRELPYVLDFDVVTLYCEHPSDTIHTTLEFHVRTVSDGTLDIVPNVFSPNDDGLNDRWEIVHTPDKCITNEDVQIFNRWGNQVFQANTMQRPWTGDSSEGAYFYTIKYEFLWDPRSDSGEITLFK